MPKPENLPNVVNATAEGGVSHAKIRTSKRLPESQARKTARERLRKLLGRRGEDKAK
jgi:hypothetical protein